MDQDPVHARAHPETFPGPRAEPSLQVVPTRPHAASRPPRRLPARSCAVSVRSPRLLEFFGPAIHWNRSLWSIGSSLALREVLEASEAHRAGILGPESLQAAISTSTRLIAATLGIPEVQREFLQKTLTGSKPTLTRIGARVPAARFDYSSCAIQP